jgi:hypothetical protein
MEYRLKDLRFIEKDREKTIKVDGEVFVIKALFPKDYRDISRKIAIEQNGLAVNTFSIDDRYRFQRDITIDHAIVQSPEWWVGASGCPSDEILDSLYREIQEWTDEFQELLKKNRHTARGNEPKVSN